MPDKLAVIANGSVNLEGASGWELSKEYLTLGFKGVDIKSTDEVEYELQWDDWNYISLKG